MQIIMTNYKETALTYLKRHPENAEFIALDNMDAMHEIELTEAADFWQNVFEEIQFFKKAPDLV